MVAAIPDLWSNDIKVDVLPPIAVLKAQEGFLAKKTQGMLQAKLTTTETDKLVQHSLDLIAPGLNFYRERLLSATHDAVMLYPVTVASEAFRTKRLHPANTMEKVVEAVDDLTSTIGQVTGSTAVRRHVATDEEFIRLVREILQSENVRSLIHSLIARINARNANESEQPNDGIDKNGEEPH